MNIALKPMQTQKNTENNKFFTKNINVTVIDRHIYR